MILAKVLTGDYCQGWPGLTEPPSRNDRKSGEKFDSVTDVKTNPKMFVIFNRDQAYPEYLFTLQS